MLKKLLLVLEVIALFLIGALLAIYIGKWTGIDQWLSQANILALEDPVDFTSLSIRTVSGLLIKYGTIFIFALIFLGAIKSGYPLKSIGLSVKGMSVGYILKVSVLIFCIGGIVPKFLFYLWPTGAIGDGPAGWQLLNQTWSGGFWIYMLISSIIIPPIVEEIFFRGYAQSRLEQRFSPGKAILIVAIIFTAFHTQYLTASPITIMMAISLLFSSMVLGYSRHLTGSIIPGMIAHAFVNIPVIGNSALILTVAMAVILILNWKGLLKHTRLFLLLITGPDRNSASEQGIREV